MADQLILPEVGRTFLVRLRNPQFLQMAFTFSHLKTCKVTESCFSFSTEPVLISHREKLKALLHFPAPAQTFSCMDCITLHRTHAAGRETEARRLPGCAKCIHERARKPRWQCCPINLGEFIPPSFFFFLVVAYLRTLLKLSNSLQRFYSVQRIYKLFEAVVWSLLSSAD